MIVIMRDAVMPDCCNTCVCSEGYGCGITGTVMTTKEMEERPDWCPLEERESCEDTISRQAAIAALNEYFARIEKLKRRGLTKGEKAISLDTVGAIKTLPSAQPEIIRCKDCKYNVSSHKCLYPESFFLVPVDDFYCGYAERRTDG